MKRMKFFTKHNRDRWLFFVLWMIVATIFYVIYPSEIPHKINCDNTQHQEVMSWINKLLNHY